MTAPADRTAGRSSRPLRPRSRHRADHRPRHLAHPRRLRLLHRARPRDSGNRLGSRELRAGSRRPPLLRRGAQNPHPCVQPRRPRACHPRRRHHRNRRAQRGTASQSRPPHLRTAPVPRTLTPARPREPGYLSHRDHDQRSGSPRASSQIPGTRALPAAPPRPPRADQGRLAPARRGPHGQGGDPAGDLTPARRENKRPPAWKTGGRQPGENKATQPDFPMAVDMRGAPPISRLCEGTRAPLPGGSVLPM
jgi:hypothetical protein